MSEFFKGGFDPNNMGDRHRRMQEILEVARRELEWRAANGETGPDVNSVGSDGDNNVIDLRSRLLGRNRSNATANPTAPTAPASQYEFGQWLGGLAPTIVDQLQQIENEDAELIPAQLAEYAAEAARKGIIIDEGEVVVHGPDGNVERKIGPLGEWFVADGIAINPKSSGIKIAPYLTALPIGSAIPKNRLQQVGTYNQSNGLVGFIDGTGRLRVSPYTAERLRALVDRGYEFDENLYVVFSSNEKPADPSQSQAWGKLRSSIRKAAMENEGRALIDSM